MQKKDKATLIQISTSDFIVDMHNTRQSWIDTAKGLLISLMVLGHLTIWMTDLGIQDPFHPYVCSVKIVYQCFFMQSFFIITGYCTNWNRNLGIFFFRNVKSLILPTCLIFS